jgi:hypothetical protein
MRAVLAAGALALALCGGAAAAATFTVRAAGTILPGGVDNLGVFGAAGSDLSGASFTALLTFDLDKGVLVAQGPTSQEIEGAIQSASINVNGVAHDFLSLGHLSPSNDISYDSTVDDQFSVGDGLGSALTFGFRAGLDRIARTGAFMGDEQNGSFEIDFDGKSGESFGAFDLQRFSVTTSAVPEPASWALLLGGVFGVGAILRRRRLALA